MQICLFRKKIPGVYSQP